MEIIDNRRNLNLNILRLCYENKLTKQIYRGEKHLYVMDPVDVPILYEGLSVKTRKWFIHKRIESKIHEPIRVLLI